VAAHGGLNTIDVSDPAPRKLGRLDWNTWAFDLVGGLAYVADELGVSVADASNPSVPLRIGSTGPATSDIEVQASFAFVVGQPGFRTIDLSRTAFPAQTGSFTTPAPVKAVEVAGASAYVASEGGVLHVLDVSNPSAPVQRGVFQLSAEPFGAEIADVEVAGSSSRLPRRRACA
jgi:hypothetical protein